MQVSDFEFELPDNLIAQEPPPVRGTSRLLVLERATGDTQHLGIDDLPGLLRRGDLLVVNNTRVFPARLLGHRVPSGGGVECLLLSQDDEHTWDALVHPGQKLGPGAVVRFEGEAGALVGEILARQGYGRRRVRLSLERGASIVAVIEGIGHVPLPPYIRRLETDADRDRYQTVFAKVSGSVAAPTAGLHFTDDVLSAIAARGVERVEITLHVGYGTFKPVRVDRVEDHMVDPEHYEISPEAAGRIEAARRESRRIVVTGTTTTRALESAAFDGGGPIGPGRRIATAFIYPGFRFQVTGALLTNFHVPRSSLLMLVSAFAGRGRVLAAYQEAVDRKYRFYSYGDAMIII